jgi:hypothetical protein
LLKKLLVDLYQLGITDTELEDGTVIENISLVPGKFPGSCRGILTAVVNGYKIEVEAPFSAEIESPFHLPCQDCGGCE